MSLKHLILVIVATFILFGCAEKKDPVSPDEQKEIFEIVDNITVTGDPKTIDVTESRIYVAEDQNGFSIYNRETLDQIVNCGIINSISLQGVGLIKPLESYGLVFVYNAGASKEIIMIDMSNPDSLGYVTTFLGGTYSIKTLYAMENPYEVSDNNPFNVPVSECELSVLWTNGNELKYGFIDANYGGQPDTYVWQGAVPYIFTGDLNNFAMDDDYFYVTAEQVGLYIVNRATGDQIGWCDTPGEAMDVVLHGDYAYAADRQNGVQVIDISDVTQPDLLEGAGFDPSYGYAYSVDVMGDYLLAAIGGGGLYIFDITDPAAPEFAQRITSSEIGYCREVKVFDDKAYVVSRDNGIVILEMN